MSYSSSNLVPYNSTTFADVVGMQMGESRLPGETSTQFLVRLSQAVTSSRDTSYEGILNSISLEFNLNMWNGISVSYENSLSANPYLNITCEIGQITLDTDQGTTVIPVVNISADNYWKWLLLSEVVILLNNVPGVTAILSGPDGSAIQIVKQKNVVTVVAEEINSQNQFLENTNIISGSEFFNVFPGVYTLNYHTGQLIFTGMPPSGLTVFYQRRGLPYNIVCSQAAVFSLTDPSIKNIGINSSNIPVYQVQEILQDIMQNDLSYWGV